jgi:type IV pilus assembly protein PilB
VHAHARTHAQVTRRRASTNLQTMHDVEQSKRRDLPEEIKSGQGNADDESVGDQPETRAQVSELSLLRPAERVPEPGGGGGHAATLIQQIGDGRPVRLIGDVVVEMGFATREKVEDAVEIARAQGKPTGQVLVEQGVLRHDQLARVVAERFGLDYIDLSVYELDMGAVNLIDMDAIRRYQAVPVGFLEDGTLLLAMADPTNVLSIDDIAMLTGRRVRSASASVEDLNILIMRLSRVEQSVEEIVEEEETQAEAELHMDEADKDAPVIKLVHSIIAEAIEQGASDIHIDPGEGDMRVLLRIDGVLSQTATLKRSMANSVISRVKIMSEMDISERRVPQDGRFALTVNGRRVDVRVTTLPLVYGEGAYLRILDKGVAVRGLESLGMQRTEQDRFAYAIARPNGAVLVTGPTGSGKSTTLYAALGAVNDGSRSILTIEDPVESRIAGVKQMQVAPKAGMTFAGGLRAMLRADPDVIMVGEIRDRETAHIAVEAALTGHLVLSTLHTRDAPSALGRLIDMGIEPFLISSAIDCLVAQRLVRVLCPHCKQPSKAPEALLAEYGLYESEAFEPVGCTRCAATGYRGRMGIYEVMSVSEEIRSLVLARGSVDEIAATAVGQGMRRMREDGIAKVRAGQTSIAEIERMTTSML